MRGWESIGNMPDYGDFGSGKLNEGFSSGCASNRREDFKGAKPEEKEFLRYGRQLILPQVGREGQLKLKRASVLIIGAGGLASPVSLYLAGAGIGTIGIADMDSVDISNLHRQILHDTFSIGRNKAESAKERLTALNPEVRINSFNMEVTADSIGDLIGDYDFVVDAVDNFKGKFLINDVCVAEKKPFCHGGVLGFTGQVLTYVPERGPCYRCIFGDIPEEGSVPTCREAGILGPVAGVIGSIQAMEVLKYFLGMDDMLVGRMFIFDGISMESRIAAFPERNKRCSACGRGV